MGCRIFCLSGSKTAESLREKLRDAIDKKDKVALENILEECIASGMPELDSDIRHARGALDSIQDLDERPPKGQKFKAFAEEYFNPPQLFKIEFRIYEPFLFVFITSLKCFLLI